MDESPFISICIPAYQRTGFLKRLLDSISIQNYPFFEVVITDDSPGFEVQELVEQHSIRSKIRYFKNQVTLGTPENWNEGLRKAKSDWIKIMHDDDWFSAPDSLGDFAQIICNSGSSFYFSDYSNVYPDGSVNQVKISNGLLHSLQKNPVRLLAANRVGPPSAVIFKKDLYVLFDSRMKWLVDIDYYINYLNAHPPPVHIAKNLVQIGISDSQVTRSSFGNRRIEIPERFLLNEKLESDSLRDMVVYDSWWRFIRNMKIRDVTEIQKTGFSGEIPVQIRRIISFQNQLRPSTLRIGIFSKSFMILHYFLIYCRYKQKPL